jgi:hypothetical protein
MFEDTYYMEGRIGNWKSAEDRYYAEQEGMPRPEDAYCPDLDDDEYYDEADESVENADLDFDQSDY